MDINTVLVRLMRDYGSLPAVKLAWNCQLDLCDPKDIPKISPTHFLRELDYTSEERHALLTEQHKSMKFSSNGFKIEVEPSILAFQKYKGGDKLGATITVRNIDKTMQKISFRMNESGPFLIDDNSRKIGKFASGLLTSVVIIFKPEDEQDYYHKLIIGVNGTRISIPVIGFGARGVLDFPDKINFDQLPVNYQNNRLFTVLNIGTRTAKFIISTKAPFAVSPAKGIVLPNDSINLTLSFTSATVGTSVGFLRVKYDTGEEIHVELEGEAINEDITFNPMDIEFQDTFLGMVSQGRITIRNNSTFKTKFQWRKYNSAASFYHANKDSIHTLHHKDHFDISADHEQMERDKKRLYSRGDSLGINQIIQGQKEPGGLGSDIHEPFYVHESFRIEPPIGEIQPNSALDLLVLFSPLKSGMYFSEAFCQIDGLEERAEMRLIGKALGAKFKFGFDTLDVGGVCVGGGHTYEIPVTNTSAVEGTINFDGFVGLMDGQLEINPKVITLSPGEFSAFFLYFCPLGKAGPIFEEIRFQVKDTKELISVIFKGETIFPSIRFSESMLEFSEVSYGFSELRQIVLMNDSMIPLDISLAIEPDGTEQVLGAEDILNALRDPDFVLPVAPREFGIDPSRFVLSPRGFQRLTVTLTPATYGDYNRELIVRLGDDPEALKVLPIEGRCLVPTLIKPEEPIVVNCVAGYPCPGSFTVHNPSGMSAVYCCVPATTENVLFSSENFLGIVKPRESTTIPFMATTKVKGDSDAIIEFFVAGKVDPIIDLVVTCHTISASGAIKVDRKIIDLGKTRVRVKAMETFKIMNSSSVQIPFNFSMIKGGAMREIWEIEPPSGFALPLGDTEVSVSVTLNEIGSYKAIFRLQIPGCKETSDIEVSVIGFGCPIVFSPELDENGLVDFGYIFTHSPTILSYELTNPGFLTKHLEWKLVNEEPPVNPEIYDGKKKKKKEMDKLELKKPPKPKQRHSVFEIFPMKKVLNGEESFTLAIKANSNIPQKAEMSFTLWAYAEMPRDPDRDFQKRISQANVGHHIGRKIELSAKDQVFLPTAAETIKIVAEFALPKLKFTPHRIEFRIDPNPTDYSNIYQQTTTLIIENPCNSPLAVILHTASPFGIIWNEVTLEEWKYTFGPKETLHLQIIFDISRFSKDSGVTNFSGTLDCIYEKHPASDESIELTGDLHFPTVILERDEIDFGEVCNGQEAVQEIIVTNPGKYCITYKIYMVADCVLMDVVNTRDAEIEALKEQELDLLYTASGFDMYQQELLQIGGKQESISQEPAAPCTELIDADVSEDENLKDCEGHKKSMKFFYDKFYRNKLMSFLGVRDTDQEPNNELTYLHYFQERPVTPGMSRDPNEVIDIIPANGFIQAGNHQKFTVVFYAQSNIHFEAKICFSVENGASKFFTIKGQSVPPPNPYAYLTATYDVC